MGAMKLIPHLSFNGQCEEAFAVYARCLGGAVTMMLRHGETLAAVAPEMRDRIAHATLRVGDQTLTGADVPAEDFAPMRGFAVQVNLHDREKAQTIFATFAAGGEVLVPLDRTFWAELYGMVTDRFGTPWEINYSADA